MTDKRQSDALHLADIADDGAWTFVIGVRKEIAAELRRQYAEIETLRMGYNAARLEIESLRKEHADELAVAYMCGASREKELAAQQEPSCTSVQLAEMVLSDCGHSSSYTPLLNRVAARIDWYVERRLESKKTTQQEAQSALFDKQGFREWVLHNLPYDTIIGNSAYWADHLSKGIQHFVKAAPQPSPAAQSGVEDTALLDWLNENIFYREMGEWDAKYGHGDGYNMWVLFAPKGVRGSARTIISAARAAQEGR